MICKNCGKNINDSMKFCPYCGMMLNSGGQKVYFALKSEIDRAINGRNFNLVWDEILNKNNAYAEYAYEKFFHNVLKDVQDMEDFKAVTQKIAAYIKNGSLYAAYLYGCALMWSYEERRMFAGSDYLGGPNQVTQGKTIVSEMADRGQTSAQAMVGEWYKYGKRGCLKNDITAYKLLKAASDKLHPTAMYELAESYQKGGLGLQENKKLSEKYMERAAYFGYSKAKREINNDFEDNKRQEYIAALIERYKPILKNVRCDSG